MPQQTLTDVEILQFASKGLDPAIPHKSDITVYGRTIDNTSTSIKLLGKGTDYGIPLQENMLHMLENFASSTPPSNPTVGQLWFSTGTNSLFYFDTNLSWVEVGSANVGPATSGVFKGPTEPATATDGDLWYNTAEDILYVKSVSELGPNQAAHYFNKQWAQVWPNVQIQAGLKEYNALAARINKVIGPFLAESTSTGYGYGYGSSGNAGYGYGSSGNYVYWGWGQTDLLPIFTDASTPQPFNNEAWVNLIARLRKAIRHVSDPGQNGYNETDVGTVGMINDGRGPTSLSAAWCPGINFGYGFDNNGPVTLINFWERINSGVTFLEMMRWNLSYTDWQYTDQQFVSTLPWNTQKTLTSEIKFSSELEAKYYFNRGGKINIGFFLDSFTTPLSTLWGYMMSDSQLNVSGVTLEANSVRYQNDQAVTLWPTGASAPGFYQLQSTESLIYQISRLDTAPYYTFNGVIQSGIAITAKKVNNSDGTFSIVLTIRMYENSTTSSVDGTFTIYITHNTPLLAGSLNGQPYLDSPAQVLPATSAVWSLT